MIRDTFLKKVETAVRQANSLLIADEVMVGFGRTGSLFGFKRANIFPDLIALSKGLTGGFLPMGVTMAKEKILNSEIILKVDQIILSQKKMNYG